MFRTSTIVALLVSATCACAESVDSDPFEGASEDPVFLPPPGEKADGIASSDVTPGIRWLSMRSETELAHLFANGTATHIPVGQARQQPLVSWYAAGLVPIVQAVFQGTIWEQVDTDAAGEPVIDVYSAYLGLHEDSFVAPYAGVASRSTVAQLHPISGAEPPSGRVWPHWISPYHQPIEIDERTSVFVDYQGESTPILGRAIDEFREIAPDACPGLYLVRTHYLRSRYFSAWSFLFYLAADFGPEDRECVLDTLLGP